MSLAITLHLLAAILWVGGMFFAHMALRPAAVAHLEPPLRLTLWTAVFGRFFPWVWLAVAVLLATGYWMLFAVFGGFAHAGLHIHVMNGLGLVMAALFAFLYAVPYRALRRHVAASQWQEAAGRLARIRQIVTTNLLLGLITSAVGAGGRYL